MFGSVSGSGSWYKSESKCLSWSRLGSGSGRWSYYWSWSGFKSWSESGYWYWSSSGSGYCSECWSKGK